MAYIVAKKVNTKGSIACQMDYGKEMAAIVYNLSKITLDKQIEICSVSSTKEWYEYAPYKMVGSVNEFIEAVFKLYHDQDDECLTWEEIKVRYSNQQVGLINVIWKNGGIAMAKVVCSEENATIDEITEKAIAGELYSRYTGEECDMGGLCC